MTISRSRTTTTTAAAAETENKVRSFRICARRWTSKVRSFRINRRSWTRRWTSTASAKMGNSSRSRVNETRPFGGKGKGSRSETGGKGRGS